MNPQTSPDSEQRLLGACAETGYGGETTTAVQEEDGQGLRSPCASEEGDSMGGKVRRHNLPQP